MQYQVQMDTHAAATPSFMFATGIECSCPTVGPSHARVDQMESCGHYQRWREDFDLTQALGIRFLCYGPPIHRAWTGAG